MKKILKGLLPLIGLFIFVYIVYSIGLDKIINVIIKMPPSFFLIALIITFPRIAVSTYKWWYVAKMQRIYVPYLYMLKVNFIGILYGVITPMWLGDSIRVPLIQKRSKRSFGRCLANWLIDTALELFSLFILAITGIIVLTLTLHRYEEFLIPILSIFLILIAVAMILAKKNHGKKLFNLISKFMVPKRYQSWMNRNVESFYEDMPRIRQLIIPFLVEITSYTTKFIQIYILAAGLGLRIPIFSFITIYPIASLIGQLPVTVGGLGTREGALIGLFSIFGVTSEQIVAISLVGYIITMLAPAIVGVFLSFTITTEDNASASLK